ncbi:MAG: integration host factor [Phototrophicales bacterium]|nr:MAG: integration host factor [Phototrophicales bacterium]
MVAIATTPAPRTKKKANRLTKSELIARVAAEVGISKTQAKVIVDAMLDILSENIAKGVKVNLTGFGAFELRESKARAGVNPRTLERIQIPAKKRVSFKAGATLKRAIG